MATKVNKRLQVAYTLFEEFSSDFLYAHSISVGFFMLQYLGKISSFNSVVQSPQSTFRDTMIGLSAGLAHGIGC